MTKRDPASSECTAVHARQGQIVTFVEFGPATAPFQRGVATGDHVTDPHTGRRWLSIITTDLHVTMVDPALVVDLVP